jgi:hypothetical protein
MLAFLRGASRAFPDKEVLMWRFGSSWLIVASFSMTFTLADSTLFGRDDLRTSMFRELTSDQPASPPARSAPTEPVPEAAAVAPQLVPASPAVAGPPISTPSPTFPQSPVASPMVRPASFYGRNSARQTMSQFPRRAAIRTNPQQAIRRQPKPFETAEHEPTISPYLNLDRDDDDSQNIPHYLTMVLPQLEQMQVNRVQQREIQQLHGQLQNLSMNFGPAPAYEMNRSSGMASSARFMDTAQFYGGAR